MSRLLIFSLLVALISASPGKKIIKYCFYFKFKKKTFKHLNAVAKRNNRIIGGFETAPHMNIHLSVV